jgi:hypothetical protein
MNGLFRESSLPEDLAILCSSTTFRANGLFGGLQAGSRYGAEKQSGEVAFTLFAFGHPAAELALGHWFPHPCAKHGLPRLSPPKPGRARRNQRGQAKSILECGAALFFKDGTII